MIDMEVLENLITTQKLVNGIFDDGETDESRDVLLLQALEEYKVLRQRQIAKKILYRKQSYGTPYLCPICKAGQCKVEFFCEDGSEPKKKYSYCWMCGQKMDWDK